MEPISISVAVAISLALGGISTTAALTTAIIKWDDILIALNGKKIAVLGARETGKTTLLRYITTGNLIERYNQTVTPKDTKKRRFKLDDIDIKIRKTRDVGGGKEDYQEWKKLFMESDLVFYLVRADKLLKRDLRTDQRVEADLNHIRGWFQQSKSTPQVFIIGTHCDLDPEFRNIKPNNLGDYVDRFRQLPSVTKMTVLASNVRPVKVVIGSLENDQSANQLVSQIFQQILK